MEKEIVVIKDSKPFGRAAWVEFKGREFFAVQRKRNSKTHEWYGGAWFPLADEDDADLVAEMIVAQVKLLKRLGYDEAAEKVFVEVQAELMGDGAIEKMFKQALAARANSE